MMSLRIGATEQRPEQAMLDGGELAQAVDPKADIAARQEALTTVSRGAQSGAEVFVRTHSDQIALALCTFAALRILIFAAAFPLTNNIDERFHLATVQMYAHGEIPGRELPRINPEAARTLILYWSPEYNHSQERLKARDVIGPLYRLSPEGQNSILAKEFYASQLDRWLARPNFEAQSAPLYYMVAAGWYKMGAVLGMQDWRLEYWVRFLNPLVYALLVWFSYQFCRTVYPRDTFLQIAVPALIAVFPQDVFFGMNRDVLSAPLSAAVLLLLIKTLKNEPNANRLLLLGSFFTGLAFLASVSNFVLFGPLVVTLWMYARRSFDTAGRQARIVAINLLAVGVLPSLWMLRNYLVMGDLTGGKAKAHELTWTVKPLGAMFHHPLFSFHGLAYFLVNLTRSFWQGEYTWHQAPMRSAVADRFYLVSSAALAVLFILDFIARRRSTLWLQKMAELQSLFLVAGSVLFLAFISLLFDFHECAYPSRAYPFFVSGRIISGALLPFVLIYASGLELVANRLRRWVPPLLVVGLLILFITVSEVRVRSAAFSSPYNFFALSGWQR